MSLSTPVLSEMIEDLSGSEFDTCSGYQFCYVCWNIVRTWFGTYLCKMKIRFFVQYATAFVFTNLSNLDQMKSYLAFPNLSKVNLCQVWYHLRILELKLIQS